MADAERLGADILSHDDSELTGTVLIRDPRGAGSTASRFTPPSS